MTRREMLVTAAAAGALPVSAQAAATPGPAPSGSLRAAARDAWLYTLPLIEMAATRAGTLNPPAPQSPLPQNRFRHARTLTTPQDRLVTSPNNDTLFSNAWLDLTHGPVTLTVPPTGARYISLAMMDMYTDNDAVLGTRTVGPAGGRFIVVGPGQAGSGPGVVRMTTPHAWILVRTLVDGEADLAAAHAVQDQLRLDGPTPPAPPPYATRHAAWADYFASAQALLLADPPPATDSRILAAIAPLGLDAHGGFKASRFDAAAGAEIDAGIADGRAMLQAGEPTAFIDGWSYPRPGLGVFGQDYRYRAQVALVGLAALPSVEAMYMRPVGDDARHAYFDSDATYRLSFAKDQLPPVDGFWSITMYEVTPEGQSFLTANPLNRYSIGDRTPGLKTNADGSLDIWISRHDPGGDRTANWLPGAAQGPFRITFRTYLPRAAIRDGLWRIPQLQTV